MKKKLAALLQYDSNTAFKNYHYFELSNENFMFVIHDGGRKGQQYSEEFTKEEIEIVKKIFDLI